MRQLFWNIPISLESIMNGKENEKGEYYWLEICSFESCIFSILPDSCKWCSLVSSAINTSTEIFHSQESIW